MLKKIFFEIRPKPYGRGEDIANISGATLSCAHVTEGVKRIVAVVDQARRSGVLG